MYFSYDLLNSARYLQVYIYELLAVLDTYPSKAAHLAAGDFILQQQNQCFFSLTSMDQTIGQTMNKDCKTRDEQIGFSNNANAVHRWILSFNQREEISRSCTEMIWKAEGCHTKKDLCKSRYEKDEADI